MLNLQTKISKYLSGYLDSRIILVMDLFLSLLSSLAIFMILNFVTEMSYGGSASLWVWMVSSFVGTVIALCVLKSFRNIIRHLNIRDLGGFMLDVLIKCSVMFIAVWYFSGLSMNIIVALLFDAILTLVLVVAVRILMIALYDTFRHKAKELRVRQRVLIYGTSDKSVAAFTRLQDSSHFSIVGFISGGDSQSSKMKLMDLSVYPYRSDNEIKSLMDSLSVSCILFPSEADVQKEREGLVALCVANNIRPLIVPSVEEVVAGKIMKNRVREVKIEDLLGREEIKISMEEVRANFFNKVVMVTGAAGSIGSELCRQLAGFGVKKLVLFDNAETPMHNIRLELEDRYPHLNFVPVIGDVRQIPRLDFAFREHRPQIVFHAAAYKHVPLMEENPCEAVLVNVYGSRNLADKCIEYGVEKMVMVSTDKAVNPTNIMGCTKRLAEIYVQSLGLAIENGKHEGKTKFVTTRFGNVLGSNGSVIPRFREQIEKGGPITVTHPDITRFFMTIPEACRLVMEAATMSSGNQIFVFDMGESVKIDTLARRMVELAGLKLGTDIEIEYTGLRPGEKLYEEVLSNKENTLPTSHDRIRVAKVREYDFEEILPVVEKLRDLAFDVRIPEMVVLMKETVPEFKSRNSIFEKFDK